METVIIRKLKGLSFVYSTNSSHLLKGEANYSFGFFLQMIKVSNEKLAVEVRQKSFFLRLLNSLPFLNSESIVPFYFFVNGKCHGYSRKSIFKPVFFFHIDEDLYELRGHSNNYISLMKNNIQVALFKKADLTFEEKNMYEINYDKNIQLLDVFVFCVFIDTVFYRNKRISYMKRENTYVFNDAFHHRVFWKPDSL